MVAQSAAAEAEENPLLKNLTRLGIPSDFPIEASLVSADVKAFCQLERIVTLADFANFAQNMPPQVVVGGDFRTLLNALAHVNESVLATILPFRVGSKGLHLPEALGQLVDALPQDECLALAKQRGLELTGPEDEVAAGVDDDRLAQIEEAVQQRVGQMLEFFREEVRMLPATIIEHGSLERYLVVLGNSRKEALVRGFLEPVLEQQGEAAAPVAPRKKGFFGMLFGWFGK
jgi:hypothetical protein